MDTEKFEGLVADAIDSLPEEFQERLENIDIVVADEPTNVQLRKSDIDEGDTLLGLYEGVPLPDRTAGYTFIVPDKITIFQKPIEAVCRKDSDIVTEIQRVVRHEVAHHFGIDDDRLEELGSY
jgi:predicted Zn-dependent protease with MMP-like domain